MCPYLTTVTLVTTENEVPLAGKWKVKSLVLCWTYPQFSKVLTRLLELWEQEDKWLAALAAAAHV